MNIKTILITGASKGIGASFSNFLAGEGYRIIGIARNKDQLIKTCLLYTSPSPRDTG